VRFDFLERVVGSYLPIWGHARDGAWLLDDSGVFAMLEVQGVPWDTYALQDIVGRKDRLNHTYKQIASDSIIISVYQTRGPAPETVYPVETFPSAFAASLDAAYRARLFDQMLYENRTFIGVQIRPERYAGEFIGDQIAIRQKPVEHASEERLQRLEDVVALLLAELKPYRPRRLGLRIKGSVVFSEMAEALALAMTGIWRPIGLTTGRLGESLFSEQIVIDREFIKYVLPGRVWYGAMFGMKHYPAWTYPGMYAQLLAASYLSTTCQSFRFVPTNTAQDIMRRKRSRMLLAEDPAEAQADALRVAANGLGSADYVLGDYSFSLLTFAANQKALTDVATAAWADLADSGMVVSREMLGLEAAFFSMVPGNARLRPRPGYITSANFAAMAPLHAYPIGPERGHWGAPIAIFRSRAGTPIRFHLHVDDVGNVLVTGETGSGKSLTTGFLIAMASGRARVIALDHKRGWELLIRSMNGAYAVLGAGQPSFAPLKALEPTPRNLEFLTELLRGCILMGSGPDLTPEEDRRLALGLRTVMSMPAEDRSLEEVRAFLGIDPNGAGARLDKWCWGNELGWVIDAPRDAISIDQCLHGFDTTALLDNPRARGPALLYLFHRIEMELDGKPLLIPADEGWRALLDDTFRPMIEKRLRTIRSFNGAFIFITQGPRDIVDSGIANVMVEQCPTQIHMPNPRATKADYVDGLKRTEAEFEALRRLHKGSGEFLLCQGSESVIAHLPLHGVDEHIAILSGRESTVRLFEAAMREAGNDLDRALSSFHEARVREETL
jgi:type IV secretion system protein VirB4